MSRPRRAEEGQDIAINLRPSAHWRGRPAAERIWTLPPPPLPSPRLLFTWYFSSTRPIARRRLRDTPEGVR